MPINHKCSLGLGSESMLPEPKSSNKILVLCRELRKLGQVSGRHPHTFEVFRSYPTLIAERQKQLIEGGRLLIHPLSLFSLYWGSFMVLINLLHMIISTLRLCYVCPHSMTVHQLDVALLVLHIICILDIIVNCSTGYVRGPSNVVMDKRRICCRYLKRMLIFDIISSTPLAILLLFLKKHHLSSKLILISHILPLFRFLRIYNVMKSLRIFMQIFSSSLIKQRLTQLLVIFGLLLHFFSCMHYITPVSYDYWTGKHGRFAQFIKNDAVFDVCNYTFITLYREALLISMSAFCGSAFCLFPIREASETVTNAMFILTATVFTLYTVVFLLRIYVIKYSSNLRYNELLNEVEKYMRHKEFPNSLRKRVWVFYKYKYQELYFKEEAVLDCLSEQLRHEIYLHTCHRLINNVELFEGLNANLVGTLLGCCKPEVYLPNDMVVCGGEIGNCMYFISNGTVAVYSLKGAEVCHLEDGAYFGEVALLMKDSKRVATVVAIEITEVYRLDASDFKRYIMTDRMLYQRIEALASKRMHETILVDEAFRKERDRTVHDIKE